MENFYGPKYEISLLVSIVIVLSGFIGSMRSLLTSRILSEGYSSKVLHSNTVGFFICIFSYPLLIPNYELLGASISLFIGTLSSFVMIYYYHRQITSDF